jgi:hypothetical protein
MVASQRALSKKAKSDPRKEEELSGRKNTVGGMKFQGQKRA